MTDFQIPTIAHGGRGLKPGDDPKLLRQRGAIRGLVPGARHKSATVTEDDIATYGRELVAHYEVGTFLGQIGGPTSRGGCATICSKRHWVV
jgi:hypothetical protein